MKREFDILPSVQPKHFSLQHKLTRHLAKIILCIPCLKICCFYLIRICYRLINPAFKSLLTVFFHIVDIAQHLTILSLTLWPCIQRSACRDKQLISLPLYMKSNFFMQKGKNLVLSTVGLFNAETSVYQNLNQEQSSFISSSTNTSSKHILCFLSV